MFTLTLASGLLVALVVHLALTPRNERTRHPPF